MSPLASSRVTLMKAGWGTSPEQGRHFTFHGGPVREPLSAGTCSPHTSQAPACLFVLMGAPTKKGLADQPAKEVSHSRLQECLFSRGCASGMSLMSTSNQYPPVPGQRTEGLVRGPSCSSGRRVRGVMVVPFKRWLIFTL